MKKALKFYNANSQNKKMIKQLKEVLEETSKEANGIYKKIVVVMKNIDDKNLDKLLYKFGVKYKILDNALDNIRQKDQINPRSY